ncbi:unnamed protein product [Rotaria sp. Silwood2]|nr:unnamed protein product [Rotaria sp. Silwood2]CAF4067635.1 unnamed protein product [Rotaria sp. Silwood2]
MARIKRATPRIAMPLDAKKSRLPLAVKPSKSTISSISSSTNQELSWITANLNTNSTLSSNSQLPTSLSLLKEKKSSSITTTQKITTMKKVKSVSKVQIIKCKLDEDDTDVQVLFTNVSIISNNFHIVLCIV